MERILHYARMPWPADWPTVFGRWAPLVMEIGFGGGHFLVDLARRKPHCNVLGLEISLPSLRKGARKIRLAALRNACVVQGDSRAALWLLCSPRSLTEVHINFHDPWPKAAHHQRRLINDTFLHLLATRMFSGASLDIATDHAGYADVIEERLRQSPYFSSRLASPFTIQESERLRTKYEQTALAEGRVCRYFQWRRNEEPAENRFPVLEEYAVPHVVMELALDLEEVGRRFEPFRAENAGLQISYLDMYTSLNKEMLLAEVYVAEEPFHQRSCLAIRRRHTGDVVVSLHEIGFPRPTEGMHRAVYHLVTWLQGLDPQAVIVNSTLKLGDEDP